MPKPAARLDFQAIAAAGADDCRDSASVARLLKQRVPHHVAALDRRRQSGLTPTQHARLLQRLIEDVLPRVVQGRARDDASAAAAWVRAETKSGPAIAKENARVRTHS